MRWDVIGKWWWIAAISAYAGAILLGWKRWGTHLGMAYLTILAIGVWVAMLVGCVRIVSGL